jgi:DNA invertase Pin-like site-specific DNA recombinase
MTTMIGYLRVSTEEQANSGLGLDAQRDTIQRYADAHEWGVTWYVDEGLSAKSLNRPQLQAALTLLHMSPKRRDVDGIVVARLDRLSRSVHDFSGLLKLAAARRWSVVAIDLGVDTSTPTGKLVANVMMSVAEWEREVIGERTSVAMQAAKRQGRHMGRVSTLPQAAGDRLIALRSTHTLADTARQLNAEGYTTATGLLWSPNTVTKAQKRLSAFDLTSTSNPSSSATPRSLSPSIASAKPPATTLATSTPARARQLVSAVAR